MVVASELLRQAPDQYRPKEAAISADMFPWYFSPEKPLPEPVDIHDVSLLPLRSDIIKLMNISRTENMQRQEAGLPTTEIGRSFSMDPESRLVTAEPVLIGFHDDVDSDLHLLPSRGRAPIFHVHEHNSGTVPVLQEMHSHRDHLPAVIKMPWGRLSRANLVVSQPEGKPPIFYLSLATTETPVLTKDERVAYNEKWNVISASAGLAEREQLEASLAEIYGEVYARWEAEMESGLAVVNLYKNKETLGILSPDEQVIYQSESSRLRELNRQAEVFDYHPDIQEATLRLQEHVARTDYAVRLAAAKDIGVTMLVATGWDMQFRKLDMDV